MEKVLKTLTCYLAFVVVLLHCINDIYTHTQTYFELNVPTQKLT